MVRRAFDIAQKLEGLHRHASTHAAGIVIGDRPLTELVPLYRDPKSLMPVTQFNMKWVEPAGLVKFDFLGLKTLTVLDRAVKLVRRRGIDLDLSDLPLDDAKTYDMLARGETVGVFQVESPGMRRALVDMRPDRFEDLIVLVALYRPGPMANIPTYCARKLGQEPTDYLHPKLEPILRRYLRHHHLSGTGDADRAGSRRLFARRGRHAAPRDGQERSRRRWRRSASDFISGAVERGIGRRDAEAIFEACAKFAEYGFNKSHSAPYALLTYQTAYMKANYPVEFLAASMTLAMGNTDKLAEFRAEAERLGIKVEPPSINRSGVEFDVDGNTIHYALAALRGVGRQAVEAIVAARGERPFSRPRRFRRAASIRARVNKRVLESLAAAGAFDAIERNRARVFAAVDTHAGDGATHAGERGCAANPSCSAVPAAPEPVMLPALEAVAAGRAAAARVRRGRILPLRPSARRLCGGAQAAARAVMGGILPRRESRRRGRARRRHGGGAHRTAHEQRHQDGHHRPVGPQRPLRGGAVRRRAWRNIATCWSRARRCFSFSPRRCRAKRCARASSRSSRSMQAAAKMQKGLRVFLRNEEPIAGVAKRLEPARNGTAHNGAEAGDGEVSMVLMLGNGSEVEVKLPGRFKVSPQIAGAIKAVTGVVTVEAL